MTRLHRLRCLWALLLACGPALAAKWDFDDAVNETSLGLDPGQAFFMVDVLAVRGRSAEAQSLRRALWQRQLARMRGKPMPDEPRVAQAIEQGRTLSGQQAASEDLWRDAYNASARLAYRPAAGAAELPSAFAHVKGLQPLGGGLWTQPQGGGQVRYLLALTLEATTVPLPVQLLQLRFGSAESGLTLRCLAQPSAPAGDAADSGTLAPGRTADLACEGMGEARWQMLLPTLIGAARTGGEAPLLIPGAAGADPSDAERRLWLLWNPAFDDQLAQWKRAMAEARDPGNASRRWTASPKRLAPPELLAAAASTTSSARPDTARVREAWPELKVRFMVSVLALAFFAVGRVALRHAGLPTRSMATLVMGALVAVPLVASAWGPGKLDGDGWANLGVVVSGLALAGCVSVAAIVAMLLHRLHDLLDEEGQTWPGVIGRGWRRALWMFGRATSGEFWGFVLFATWAWALAVPLGTPWTGIVGLLLLVPLWSVAWRRALSLTRAEIGVGLLVIAVWIVDLVLRHHV